MFEWSDIRIMLAVASAGSTLGAAKCLHMNQTTVSRRIQALEHALGLTLFERDTRGYALTLNGKALLELAEAMGGTAKRIETLSRSIARGTKGSIKISAAPDMHPYWVNPVTTAYRKKNPEVFFDIDDAVFNVDLGAGEADIAVRSGDEIQDEELVVRKLGKCVWAIFCSKTYVRKFGMPRSIEDLANREMFFYSPAIVDRLKVLRYLGERIKPEQVVQTFRAPTALSRTLEFSYAVGLLPVVAGASRPELVQCFTDPGFRQNVWLATSRDSYQRPLVRDFMKFFGDFTLKDGVTLV
ncbi:HTH-type transcriptional regulator YofA [Defluviimonas aquaemixtae]|uniref:HTH-type transcriptional regulator YofA n=1 Tax=Albidovulum aquaemixtae TaxID=1542388 RepID=A0A2R8BMY6_9RHOB|nr:LysR family transcriptional regulator [Defluviimonas aquaemixtae]SPH24727.1 HTH-type transcriptional regulator YofA [Defluviimonas aquaemixtae]